MPDELTAKQIERLGAELDRARVKTREGRGSTSLSYLETHDVVRTANSIFGFGGWGHEILVQERIGEVEAVSERRGEERRGYHVAYRCVVRLSVRGCVPVCGSGYGDAVEYGGDTARLTASELALKEAESDALKRAFKNFGDQFGLVLYAKESDAPAVRRARSGGQASDAQRKYVADLVGRLDEAGVLVGEERVYDFFQRRTPIADLTREQASGAIEELKKPRESADELGPALEAIIGPPDAGDFAPAEEQFSPEGYS